MASSPTLSTSSVDEALFEILGVDKLTLHREEDDEPETDERNDIPSFSLLTPPLHCHRPHTPHTPLLMESSSLLSASQCRYIIYNLGYRTTNNGGKTHGPNYITAAQHEGATVELLDPNHHKVCVFYSELVLKWMQEAFEKSGIKDAIETWCQANGLDRKYRINPRLRLLRYDARDDDIFLPHYDATTTSAGYESKLTILLYLNTGGGVHFGGGKTLCLNSLQPSEFLEISPKQGKFVVFNHELYHASQVLLSQNDLVCDTVRGGTKFVLRSDVMFSVVENQSPPPPIVELCVPPTTTTMVQDVVDDLNNSDSKLLEVLQELDMDQLPVATLLVPGPVAVEAMLVDLGLVSPTAKEFVRRCQEAVS